MSYARSAWCLAILLAGCGETFAVSLGSNATVSPDGGDEAQDASQSEPDDEEMEDQEQPDEEQPGEDEPGDEEEENEEGEPGEEEDEP